MKTVTNSDTVLHNWAHQTQEYTRNGQGTLSHDGNRLFSYRTEIARILTDNNGQKWTIITKQSYSVTTAGHKSGAIRAANHLNYFATEGSFEPKEAIKEKAIQLHKEYKSLYFKKSTLPTSIDYYETDCNRLKNFCIAFGFAIQDIPEVSSELRAKAIRYKESADKREAEKKRREQLELEQLREEDRYDFEKWLDGVNAKCPNSYSGWQSLEHFLTVRDGIVYTSGGAEAPLSHASKAIKFYYSRLQADGSFLPYQTNGHKVPLGVFTLDSIDNEGVVRAGCHRFTRTEIERFSKKWGIIAPDFRAGN